MFNGNELETGEYNKGKSRSIYERRGLNRYQAANYIGVSASLFDQLVKQGEMPQPIRVKTRVIWDVRRLDEAFDELGGYDENPWNRH
jgi:predicted DNA-binding transcriptional regulator AlpA